MVKNLLFFVGLLTVCAKVFAQAPQISYTGPQTYVVGQAITPLKPVNSGGAVPLTIYGQTSTFASGGVDEFLFVKFNYPVAGAFDAAGNLFVADELNYAVRKVTPAGVVTTLTGSAGRYGFVDGTTSSAFFKDLKGLVFDTFGNMYVADRGNYRIRKITTNGTVSTFAGNAAKGSVDGNAAAAGFSDLMAIAIDQQNNIYVADGNLIRKISPAAGVSTFVGSGAGLKAPSGLAVDKNGNIFVADAGNNQIRKITPAGIVSTFAGSATAGYIDGDVSVARFRAPSGVGIDNIGNIYISDPSNKVIRKIDINHVVSTLSGNMQTGLVDGPASSAKFNYPMGQVPDNKGNLLVLDQRNHLVRKVVLTGFTISPALPAGLSFDGKTGTISGSPQAPLTQTIYTITAYNADGSSAAQLSISAAETSPPVIASFWPGAVLPGQRIQITGSNFSTTTAVSIGGIGASFTVLSATTVMATVPQGAGASGISVTNAKGTATLSGFKLLTAPNLTVTGTAVLKTGVPITPIKIINTGGEVPAQRYHQVSRYAGSFASGFQDGENFTGTFSGPVSTLFDAAGSLLITDKGNNAVRKVTRTGTVSVFAGNRLPSMANGFGTDASFATPTNMVMDRAGNILVTDYLNSSIRKITPSGWVSTLASNLGSINVIAIDAADNLYVADNSRIRKVTPAGTVSAYAGRITSGMTNGTKETASFSGISAMAFDGAGNLFVADSGNDMVRKIDQSGIVSTYAGVPNSSAEQKNGPAATATFWGMAGLTIDAKGSIYVGENFGVRIISKGGMVSSLTTGPIKNGLPSNGDFSVASFTTANEGLCFDVFGDLYISGAGSGDIRKATLTGYSITPELPAGLSFDAKTGMISGTPTTAPTATEYTVTAYNAAGNSSVKFTFEQEGPASITSFTPGSAATGATVTITGANLSGTTAVNFGGVPALSFTVNSSTSISAVVAGGATGDVTLNTSSGTVSKAGFSYINSSSQAISFDALSPVTYGGGSITLNATATSGLAIQYTSSDPALVKITGNKAEILGAGTVTITATQAGDGSHNAAATVARTLTIEKKLLTITAENAIRVYGKDNPANVLNYTGFVAGDDESELSGKPIVATAATAVSAVGLYDIVPSGADAANYSINYVKGILRILPAPLAIKVNNASKTYGSANPVFTAAYTGFVIGDDETDLLEKPVFKTGVTAASAVGIYDLTVSGASALNYDITYTQGLVEVTQAQLTIKAMDKTKLFGTVNPELTATYTGFVNGERESALSMRVQLSTTAGTTSAPGVYPILASGASATNYSITYVAGALTISPPPFPLITALSNTAGKTGTVITITGANFQNVSAVSFGGNNASSFRIISSTTIEAIVANGASGDVLLTTVSGTVRYSGFEFLRQPYVSAESGTTFLTGGSVKLQADPNITGYTYQWFMDRQPIQGATSADFTATKGGSYYVTSSYKGISQSAEPIALTEVFSLSATNFKLTSTGVSCKGSTNGQIAIEAVKPLNYTAVLKGNGPDKTLTFTSSLLLNNLPAGTYSLCITVAGQAGYQQCFTAVIAEPKDLTVFADVGNAGKQVVLSMSGSNNYTISLNGQSYTTPNNQVTLPLQAGSNHLSVTADNLCQGIFEKTITVKQEPTAYPNPFDEVLNLDLGARLIKQGNIKVYNLFGKEVYSVGVTAKTGVLPLDLSTLPGGNYILKLSAEEFDTVIRIIKK